MLFSSSEGRWSQGIKRLLPEWYCKKYQKDYCLPVDVVQHCKRCTQYWPNSFAFNYNSMTNNLWPQHLFHSKSLCLTQDPEPDFKNQKITHTSPVVIQTQKHTECQAELSSKKNQGLESGDISSCQGSACCPCNLKDENNITTRYICNWWAVYNVCFLFSEGKWKGPNSVVYFCFSLMAFSESSPIDAELIAVKRQLIQSQVGYSRV